MVVKLFSRGCSLHEDCHDTTWHYHNLELGGDPAKAYPITHNGKSIRNYGLTAARLTVKSWVTDRLFKFERTQKQWWIFTWGENEFERYVNVNLFDDVSFTVLLHHA